MPIRILITGSRDWTDRSIVRRALEHAITELAYGNEVGAQITVVHGGAGGADRVAALEAHDLDCRDECWPADWSKGRSAGPTRNQRMVDAGADICLAFPLLGSTGTWDCVRRAIATGIPVRVHHPDGRIDTYIEPPTPAANPDDGALFDLHPETTT